MTSRQSSHSRNGRIDKLDFDSHRRPASTLDSGRSSPRGLLRDDESLLSNVVDGIIERDRRKMKQQVKKYLSFASAILSCLCAGSVTAFSVYGHLFLSELHYTQFEVNAVSIAAELATYLPVPIFGYLVDRYSPRPVHFCTALLFAFGYFLAAFAYRSGPINDGGWPYGVMMVAFVAIGMSTSGMYLSAVTACVKNFGRGKHKGLALSLPIASFGLSGMWQSQIGSRVLYVTNPDGSSGDVDVFKFFIFLGTTLLIVGLIGSMVLVVVDEEELIDEGVEDLERSGLLEESAFFRRSVLYDAVHQHNYGTTDDYESDADGHSMRQKAYEEEEEAKKTWLLNVETRRFLADPTMWFLAAGMFLVTGPVETFINNIGTMISTLYGPPLLPPMSNSPATHVSILAVTSTIARLLVGTLSDLLAPTSVENQQYHTISQPSSSSSDSSMNHKIRNFTMSRVTMLLGSATLLLGAFVLLALPVTPDALPYTTGLIGFANGATFSLVPIIISVVWGVQNFGTNWGVVAMMPALGAAVWSIVYSTVYTLHAGEDGLCFGRECWRSTVMAWALCVILALGLWGWAWRGKGGWRSRGIAV